jgi:hypothetical protein
MFAAPIDPTITTKSLSKSGRSKNGGRTCEEFLLKDVNQLLRAVIKVNPYMAPEEPDWHQVEKN